MPDGSVGHLVHFETETCPLKQHSALPTELGFLGRPSQRPKQPAVGTQKADEELEQNEASRLNEHQQSFDQNDQHMAESQGKQLQARCFDMAGQFQQSLRQRRVPQGKGADPQKRYRVQRQFKCTHQQATYARRQAGRHLDPLAALQPLGPDRRLTFLRKSHQNMEHVPRPRIDLIQPGRFQPSFRMIPRAGPNRFLKKATSTTEIGEVAPRLTHDAQTFT